MTSYKKIQRDIVSRAKECEHLIENLPDTIQQLFDKLPQSKNAINLQIYNKFIDKSIELLIDARTPHIKLDKLLINWLLKSIDKKKIYKLLDLLKIYHKKEMTTINTSDDILKEIFKYLDIYTTYGSVAIVSSWWNHIAIGMSKFHLKYYQSIGISLVSLSNITNIESFHCHFCKQRRYTIIDNKRLCSSQKCQIHKGVYNMEQSYTPCYDGAYWSCCNQRDYMTSYEVGEKYKLTRKYYEIARYPRMIGCVRSICRPTKYPSNVKIEQDRAHERILGHIETRNLI